MLSNQILHRTVQDIKKITGFECAVWDMRGICLVMTSEKMVGLDRRISVFTGTVEAEPARIGDGAGMFLVNDEDKPTYILALSGEGDNLAMAGELGVSQLSNLLFVYKEKMDKNRFIQNLILDNLLLVDIYNQAKKMKIPVELRSEERRVGKECM